MVSGLKSDRARRALAADEGAALIARLRRIFEELEDSSPRPRALMILRLRKLSQDCASRVCERVSRAVANVRCGVVNSPMKAIGVAIAAGALVAYTFAKNRS
jgi:hypothetical protein